MSVLCITPVQALNDRKTAYTTDYEDLLTPYEASAAAAGPAKKKGGNKKKKRPSAGGAEGAKRPRK